ncbi:MAG: ABC transporter permease [Desulfuromonas sp.]|nr:MAG: ABC transporter permease [Desulfuromonas sp.]
MNQAFRKKIKRNDQLAKWIITVGGMAIIFSVILILVLIAKVSLPLFLPPDSELYASNRLDNAAEVSAVAMDEYLETGYSIDASGLVSFFNIKDGSPLDHEQLSSDTGRQALVSVETFGRLQHALLWDDGSLTIEQVKFSPFFDEQNNNKRSIVHRIEQQAVFDSPTQGMPLRTLARIDEEGQQTRVDLFSANSLHVKILAVTESMFGDEEISEAEEQLEVIFKGDISALAISDDGKQLFAGSDQGELARWDLSDMDEIGLVESFQAFGDGRSITALNMVLGDISLAVGDETGQVTSWFPVRDETGNRTLTRIHDLSLHEGAVRSLARSSQDKTVISLGSQGLNFDHMTSERELLTLNPQDDIRIYQLTTRGDAIIALSDKGELLSWKLDIPHPEINFGTLFGKVWYEGYDKPVYAWQSSSASDDYEPKLSLSPLIFGTLKGTFYAMLFAVPLAIFGAIYTSQFARPRLRGIVKPTVEVMAAIPTVIIGFLAALWLAPLVERTLGSMFLSMILIPAALMVSILIWQAARKLEPLKRVERGFEFLAVVPVIIMAVAVASMLGPGMENLFFDGNLKQWLFSEMGVRYDPRNCIIIAFAMGFAVIPIIFTIAEDSLSNVPPNLKAASLALGASRWQTVWRVILPSASPGIFAGTMIGFGRAVGETMIVLMATGNTAIMDLSIFNGMRPLSANIAVEIPEAPVDGSLYRTLFLSAVILFIMTFIVNTVAEIVRQRLRAKYGRF